jgi:hypothetical protein
MLTREGYVSELVKFLEKPQYHVARCEANTATARRKAVEPRDKNTYITTTLNKKWTLLMKNAFGGIGGFALIIGVLLIILPFVYVPKTESETYQVPKSEVVLGGWTGAAAFASFKNAAKGTELDANESLNIQVNATASKRIGFSVKAVNDTTGEVLATYLFYPDLSTLNVDWIVPVASEYDFVFDSNNIFTYRDVTLIVTKQWTEIAYRDITTNYSLLPLEFVYLGVVLISAGVGLLVYFAKLKHKIHTFQNV